MFLIPASSLQLPDFLSLPGLYNCSSSTLLPACVRISHSIQPVHSQGYILIFLDQMHLLFTQVHFLFWQLGRGQYVTICWRSSWLADSNFVLEILYLLHTLFTAILFVIAYLQPGFLLNWSEVECIIIFLINMCSLWAFLSFCALAFVGFLLWSRDNIFMLSHFFSNYKWLPWNSTLGSWFGWYAFYFYFYEGSDKIFVFVIRSMCFKYLLKSIEFVSYCYCRFIANISIGKWGPVVTSGFVFLFLISV